MGKGVLYGYFIIVYSLINFSTICHAPTPLSLSKFVSNNVLMFCGIKRIMGHWVDELRYNIWLLLLDGSDIHHSAYIEVLFYLKLFHTCDPAIRFGLYWSLLKYINFLLIKKIIKKRKEKKREWSDLNIGLINQDYIMCILRIVVVYMMAKHVIKS